MSGHEPQQGDMIRVQGNREYLPVAQRVQWMRGDHPAWTIDTSVVELDFAAGYAIMRAEVRDDTDRIIGAGTKTETRKGFSDFVEKAETGAVGRALARAGYGTEDALDLEGDRFADAPIEQPRGGRGGSPSSPNDRPAAQRSPEAEALKDQVLALPGMTRARLDLLADAAGVAKGHRATADQWREMLRIAQTPIATPASPSVEPPASSALPVADQDAPAAPEGGEGSDSPPIQSPAAGEASPPGRSQPSAAPTDAEILAAAGEGAEIIPPKPGTPEYKALPNGTARAQAKAWHDVHKSEPVQESLAEALGAPEPDR